MATGADPGMTLIQIIVSKLGDAGVVAVAGVVVYKVVPMIFNLWKENQRLKAEKIADAISALSKAVGRIEESDRQRGLEMAEFRRAMEHHDQRMSFVMSLEPLMQRLLAVLEEFLSVRKRSVENGEFPTGSGTRPEKEQIKTEKIPIGSGKVMVTTKKPGQGGK